jgi:hypothetical protein
MLDCAMLRPIRKQIPIARIFFAARIAFFLIGEKIKHLKDQIIHSSAS